ncbi:Eco47II family restriction endonuclease [Jeotgalibaca porci]|uniref:Eco47II family restriction endonuclease n=1 Tax=Jeotgalibaca porci TaxID=1868793 RepID=UPI0035A05CBB
MTLYRKRAVTWPFNFYTIIWSLSWGTTIDGNKISNKSIRRISSDKFYELVTGDSDAFINLCKILPEIVAKVIADSDDVTVPNDTVYEEIQQTAVDQGITFGMALYLLCFSSYSGFADII